MSMFWRMRDGATSSEEEDTDEEDDFTCSDEDEEEEEEDSDNDCSGPERELWDACAENRVDEINELIEIGVDVDELDPVHGTAPIHVAVERGNLSAVRALVEGDADLTVTDEEGLTALHTAMSTDGQIARFLIESGADVNARDRDDDTPLHDLVTASEEDDCDALSIGLALIAAGADVNASNEIGRTPLHSAVEHGQPWAVQMLLEANCDVNALDEEGESPLHMAATNEADDDNSTAVMRSLLRGPCAIDLAKPDGCTALHIAVHHRATDLIPLLLQAGANPDIESDMCGTPRHLAATGGLLALFEASLCPTRQLPALQPALPVATWEQLPRLDDRASVITLAADAKSSGPLVVRTAPDVAATVLGSIAAGEQVRCKPRPHAAKDGSIWLELCECSWLTAHEGESQKKALDADTAAESAAWVCTVDDNGGETPGLNWLMDAVSMLLGFTVLAPLPALFSPHVCDHTTAQVLHAIRRFFRLGANKIVLADVVKEVTTAGRPGDGLSGALVTIARRSLSGLSSESECILTLEPTILTVEALPLLVREGTRTFVIVTMCDTPDSLAKLERVAMEMDDKLLLAISQQAGSDTTKLQMNRMGWEGKRPRLKGALNGGAHPNPTESTTRAEVNLAVARAHFKTLAPELSSREGLDANGGTEGAEHVSGADGSGAAVPIAPQSPVSPAAEAAAAAGGDPAVASSSVLPDAEQLSQVLGITPQDAAQWLAIAGGDIAQAVELFVAS